MGCLFSISVMADENRSVSTAFAPSLSITSAGEDNSFQNSGFPDNSAGSGPGILATNKIIRGDTIFIGENNLDVVSALDNATSVAWWQSGNDSNSNPDVVLPLTTPQVFYVDPVFFTLKTGNWYQWADNQKGELAFTVVDPSLSLGIRDVTIDEDVTGGVIQRGNIGNFVIGSNLYPIVNRSGYNPADSRFKITMTDPFGDSYDFLVGTLGNEHSLTSLQVNGPKWYWVGYNNDHSVPDPHDGWNTSAVYPNGTLIYQPGVYSFRAECNVNDMKNNYKAPDGSDYTNKTVSMVSNITLADDIVSITANPELVAPGESFHTVITGKPQGEYYLWMKGTGSMSGEAGDQPPMITSGQQNVTHDAPAGPFAIGAYVFSDGSGKTIRDDIPHDKTWNGTQFYGMVKLDNAGQLSVLWNTSAATKPGSYMPYLEQKTDSGYVGDSCTLSVQQEQSVSIEASGIQPYYRGNPVTLSGINRASEMTYLFMTGTGLPASGGSLSSPLNQVISDVPTSFDSVQVSDNDTWVYTWQVPAAIPSDGTFTLYAVSMPKNLTSIGEASYGFVPVTISTQGNNSSINLVSGWNFISTPTILAGGHDTMALFSAVNSSGHSVLTFDGVTSSWVTMKPTDSFYPLNGVWIYSVSPVQIPLVSGNGTLTPRTLMNGWNCIGILSPDRSAASVLKPLNSSWSYLVGYNGTLQQYTTPLVAEDPALNSTILHEKEGMWIFIKENVTFSG